MKKMNVKKFARTFLVLIAVFALACAFSSMAFAADGETAAKIGRPKRTVPASA